MEHQSKSIVLIGFMGAGKTTIGKWVAKKLGRKFVDVDEEIEKEFQLPASKIFETFGEPAFREREQSLIASLVRQDQLVLSLGGGAFLQEETRKICLSSSLVIYLDLSFERWKDRLDLIIDSRPVLKGKTIHEMEELFYKRQEIYAHHHIKIAVDSGEADQLAEEIVKIVKHNRG